MLNQQACSFVTFYDPVKETYTWLYPGTNKLKHKYSIRKSSKERKDVDLELKFLKHIEFQGLVWFVGFYGISTFVGYLTPNPFLCK